MSTEELFITQTCELLGDGEAWDRLPKEGELPDMPTLRDLLCRLRDGYILYRPVLVELEARTRIASGDTASRTLSRAPVHLAGWEERYGGEYANRACFFVGNNDLEDVEARVMIGRSRRCDVIIRHPSVSRQHSSITYERASGIYYVVDEFSANGTFIDDKELKPGERVAVSSGAFISFGDAVFVFVDPQALRRMSESVNC